MATADVLCPEIIYAAFTFLIYYANKNSADAAKEAANAADSTLKWTKEQFRTEQRPYLSAEGRGGTSQSGGKTAIIVVDPKTGIGGLAVAVDLRNVGKSPAADAHASATAYKLGPRDTVRREVQHYKPQYSAETAGSIVTMGNGVTAPSEVRILKPDELRHIEDGTWELYIVGGVVYRDVFTPRIDPYETTYCYLFAPKGIPLHNCNFPPPSFGNSIK